jgi:hypothetical protein
MHQSANEKPETRKNLVLQGFTLLNCLYFPLTQNEFRLKDIKTSNIFLKLDMKKIKNLIMINVDSDESELDDNLDTDLYVQVNNKLVRKLKLIDLLNNKKNEILNDENEQNSKTVSDKNSNNENNDDSEDININNTEEAEINMNENIHKSKDNDNLIERIDIKNILEEELVNKLEYSHSNQQDSLPTINIRFFIKTQLMSLIDSSNTKIDELNMHFSKINENVALHVKFGDFLPNNSLKQRSKRHSIKKSNKLKNYRDCSELRRHGYTSNNYTCCRETISFSIEQIGWSHWILSPKIIEYKYCRGGCYGRNFFSLIKNIKNLNQIIYLF